MPMPVDGARIGLPQHALDRLLPAFDAYPEVDRVILFGSRAKGNFRQGSDIDLCLVAPTLSMSRCLALENALDDLLLPWKIDLVRWDDIDNPDLRSHIKRCGLVLRDSDGMR